MKTIRTSISVMLLTVALFFTAGCTKPNNENNDNNGGGSTPGGNDNGGGGSGTETLFLPSIQTLSVTDVTMSSAICEGLVDDDGGSPVTERGICWSTSTNPTVNGSHSVSGNGTGAFNVTITGLSEGTTYHVRAYAVNAKGTAYGGDVGFTTTAPSTYPNGVLPGVFSVSYSQKIRFSQGNLQYIGRGEYWRFADHQWEHLGDNGQASSNYANRDLFSWGTSGWDCGNTYYKPYEHIGAENDGTLFGPPGKTDLVYQYANSDWGVYNAIVNGGNRPNLWRTPTEREWVYLFKSRSASTVNGVNNARYTIAIVNNVFGMIVFPDVYTHPSGVALPKKQNINATDPTTNDFSTYNGSDWLQMEEAGCVFLPITGFLVSSGYSPYGEKYGYYWTTTCSPNYEDKGLCFGFEDRRATVHGGTFYFEHGAKNGTCAVRLVQDY